MAFYYALKTVYAIDHQVIVGVNREVMNRVCSLEDIKSKAKQTIKANEQTIINCGGIYMLTKQDLVNIFSVAREQQLPFVVVGIEAEGTKEAIVVPAESFDAKEQFYLNAYSDDLVHVMNSKVRIFNVIATSTEGISYIFD